MVLIGWMSAQNRMFWRAPARCDVCLERIERLFTWAMMEVSLVLFRPITSFKGGRQANIGRHNHVTRCSCWQQVRAWKERRVSQVARHSMLWHDVQWPHRSPTTRSTSFWRNIAHSCDLVPPQGPRCFPHPFVIIFTSVSAYFKRRWRASESVGMREVHAPAKSETASCVIESLDFDDKFSGKLPRHSLSDGQ